MPKKTKILISILVAVALLIVGGAVTVMAQDEPVDEGSAPTAETGPEGLLSRVAGILEIPQEELVSAFQQATGEIRQEATDRALAKAVEAGKIDETEAAAIKEWLAQKPAAVDQFQQQRARFAKPFRGHLKGFWGQRWDGVESPWHSD